MPLPQQGIIQRSFGGGELAPTQHAHADQLKYETGLRRCRNFFVLRAGGVANRPGLRFIGACKTTAAGVRLLRYTSEVAGESILIEAGNGYLRFFKNGAPVTIAAPSAWSAIVTYVPGDLVVQGGVNYWAVIGSLNQVPPNATFWYALTGSTLEISHPFGVDPFYWSQSGRTLTLTHEAHAPVELTYVSLTRWQLVPVTTAPIIPVPTGLVLVPGGAGTRRYAYVVTAGLAETYEESNPSGQVINLTCAVPTPDAPHVLTWTPVAGAAEYYVYSDPYFNGTYGFLGTATGAATFKDVGFVPDFTVTPPIPRPLFASVNNYPKVSATHKQRRFFAFTNTMPDGIWASRVGFPSNYGISSPLQADDALTFRIAGGNHHPVRHLVGLKSLVVLTDAGEWSVHGSSDGVLAPNSINPDQETYTGVSLVVPPVVVGNSIIYVQARGAIVRDLRFDNQVDGLGGRDLTVFSSHLVDDFTIVDMDYAQAPHSIIWCVRSDGTLLGMTYLRVGAGQYGQAPTGETEVWGWHRHDTSAAGKFEQVCVVPETGEDAVYVIVKRTIGGGTVRYIERFARRTLASMLNSDVFFVDAGLSYSGAPVTNIAGLDHLNGQVVAVVGDGVVLYNGDPAGALAANFTVTGGTLPVALTVACSDIHAGLAIQYPEIELLDLDAPQTDVRDKQKRVNAVNVLVDTSSRSFWAGPDTAHLRQYVPPTYDPAAATYTGQVELALTSAFNRYGRVFFRQTDPLPLTILAVIPHGELGG